MDKSFIHHLIQECQPAVIVAATKYVNKDGIKKLSSLGIHDVGENRVDAFLNKYDPSIDVKWHFIGHLQKNKVKKVISFVDCLHSLDSLETARLIDRYRDKPLDTFIEVKLTNSETKNGILPEQLDFFIEELKKYKNIHLVGLMTMNEANSSEQEKNDVFKKLDELKNKYHLPYTSMGMSDDYPLALIHHATHLRLGRILYEYDDILDEFKYYFK